MLYLFRGLRRGSGDPVTGRLDAPDEDAALGVIENHAIIAESIGPEPEGGLLPPPLAEALRDAGVRVSFNQFARYDEGHGVWILHHDRIADRVRQLALEALGPRSPELHRIEDVLEVVFAEKPSPETMLPPQMMPMIDESRFANAAEVRSEIRRLMTSINRLERELIAMKSRPAAPAERATRRVVPNGAPRDRTRDEVLQEIFRHNLELMKLTRGQAD